MMASMMFNGSLSLNSVASRLFLFKTSVGHDIDTVSREMSVSSSMA
jgi:hypothetical protein